MAETIGGRIRSRRVSLGMKQTALADKLHIPRQTMSKIELGRQRLYDEQIIVLAITLNMSSDEILGLRRGQETVIERVHSPSEDDAEGWAIEPGSLSHPPPITPKAVE